MDTKVYLSIDYQKLMELRKSSSFLLVLVFLTSGLATSGCLEEIENDDVVERLKSMMEDEESQKQNGGLSHLETRVCCFLSTRDAGVV